jgi:hypothetical protein
VKMNYSSDGGQSRQGGPGDHQAQAAPNQRQRTDPAFWRTLTSLPDRVTRLEVEKSALKVKVACLQEGIARLQRENVVLRNAVGRMEHPAQNVLQSQLSQVSAAPSREATPATLPSIRSLSLLTEHQHHEGGGNNASAGAHGMYHGQGGIVPGTQQQPLPRLATSQDLRPSFEAPGQLTPAALNNLPVSSRWNPEGSNGNVSTN